MYNKKDIHSTYLNTPSFSFHDLFNDFLNQIWCKLPENNLTKETVSGKDGGREAL
jgi:hypothetical protein